jgi:hypothetical protein
MTAAGNQFVERSALPAAAARGPQKRIAAVVRTSVVAGALLGWAAAGAAQDQQALLGHIVQGKQGWFRYNIAGGRVTLGGTQFPILQLAMGDDPRKETLKISNDNGQPSLAYERTSPEEQLQIEVVASSRRVCIRRTPRGKSSGPPVEFLQVANENISLSVGAGAGRQLFRAPGIWQLLLAQPQECRRHLLPLLEMLRPDWRLAAAAAQVERGLLHLANADTAAERARLAALVAQLGDDRFANRKAADHALRAGGTAAHAYLRQLDLKRLDTEQQFRVLKIIEALTPRGGDSPEQVAASLANDPTVWLTLLARPEPATRQAAARRLAALLEEPLPVDPAADPETQKDQREQLRARIEAR